MNGINALLTRTSEHPVDSLFLSRWSPRAYDATPLPLDDLLTVLEAARWAPSAYNKQPWRFIYALRGDDHWSHFVSLLDSFNAEWAQHAGALVFLLSDTRAASHRFDAGAAWSHIALQAHQLGYQAHAMSGIFHNRAKQDLGVPEDFAVEIGIAIGTMGNVERLPPTLRDREKPSMRLPLAELVFNGRFSE